MRTGRQPSCRFGGGGPFHIEAAKYYGSGKCCFYQEDQYRHLTELYGTMKHLQTPAICGIR